MRGGSGALPPCPRRGSRWRRPAARAGLVWRLRAKQTAYYPGPRRNLAFTWGTKGGTLTLCRYPCGFSVPMSLNTKAQLRILGLQFRTLKGT